MNDRASSDPGRWITRAEVGPIVAVGGLIAGSRLAEAVPIAPTGPVIATGVGALVAAWFTRHGGARVALAALGLAALGAATMTRALDGMVHHPLREQVATGMPVLVRGEVAVDPNPSRWSTDLVVRVRAVRALRTASFVPVRSTRILVRATADDARRAAALVTGDRVVIDVELAPLRGFDGRRRWEHVVARTSRAEIIAVEPARALHARIANAIRECLLAGMRSLPADDRALLAGFLLGDTRALPDGVRDDFRASGLSHLLAVSGSNVAFVLALVVPLLNRARLSTRFVVTVGVIATFAAVTRFEPSVLRASAMASVAALTTLLGRPTGALRRLAIAAIALLLADPFLTHSVGFALSCGASAGIVMLAAPIADALRGPEWFRASLSVSLAAQVGVLPVTLAVFGSMPAVAPLANLLAVPAAEPLTVLGLLTSAALGLVGSWAPGACEAVQWPVIGLLVWVRAVAAGAARLALGLDAWGSGVALLAGALFARRAHRTRAHRRRVHLGDSVPGDGSRSDPDARASTDPPGPDVAPR